MIDTGEKLLIKVLAVISILLLHLVVLVSGSSLSTVVPIVVLRHEASNTGNGGVLPEAHDLTTVLYTVVLEGLEGDGLGPTLDFLGLGVDLLLALLSSSTETKDQVQSALLLDVVVTQGAAILELLSSEDKTLLIRGNSLLILDLCLYVIDSIRWLNIKRNGLAFSTRCIPVIGSLMND